MPSIKDSRTGEGARPVIILDGSGDQVTSFGGAGGGDASLTEQQAQTALLTTIDADTGDIATSATALANAVYTEADTDATINGIPMLWEDTSDTLRAVSAAKPLPVGDASAAALLTTIDADTGTMAGYLGTMDADTGSIASDAGYIKTAVQSVADTVATTSAVPSGSDKGIPPLVIRDDALSTLGVTEGDWVPLRADANGALWMQFAGALAPSTDGVYVGASTSGGYTPSKLLDIDETEDEIKATAGKVGGWVLTNLHSATVYVKFYNATAANVTVGSTTPVITIAIPATSGVVMPFGGPGIAFGTAICIAATLDEADADSTAIPSANLVVGTVFYI